MSDDTYRAIRKAANDRLGTQSEDAKLIASVLQDRQVSDFCLFAPCHASDNRPGPDDEACPIGDVYACVQIEPFFRVPLTRAWYRSTRTTAQM